MVIVLPGGGVPVRAVRIGEEWIGALVFVLESEGTPGESVLVWWFVGLELGGSIEGFRVYVAKGRLKGYSGGGPTVVATAMY